MWLKIVKGIYVAAKATGLDKKLVGWMKRRLQKQAYKVVNKIGEIESVYIDNPELEGGRDD